MRDRLKSREQFLEENPRFVEDDSKQNVAQTDEDSLKDFCCKKAHGETLQLLEDIVDYYEKRGGRVEPFKGALNYLKQENASCEVIKDFLMQISKRKKYGENIPTPKNKKINPYVLRAQEILNDLERCEGVRKAWFASLKSNDRQIIK